MAGLDHYQNTAAILYWIQGIPQIFLIGPNGVVIGKNLRGEELDKKMAGLFNGYGGAILSFAYSIFIPQIVAQIWPSAR